MDKSLIDKYIAMPMAVTVFNQDKKYFEDFKLSSVYLDKIDAVINQIKEDYFALKRDMITKRHIDIKRINQCKYKVNGKVIEYTPEELRLITMNIMRDYLYGDKAKPLEPKERMWNQ